MDTEASSTANTGVGGDASSWAGESPARRPWWHRLTSNLGLGILSLIGVLGIWEATSRAEVINPLFFSRPTELLTGFVDLFVVTGEIYPHMWASAQTGFWGMLLSLLVGIPVGAIIGRYRVPRALLEPYVVALYSTPRVALLPLLILVLGIGMVSKILLIFLGAVFPIIINSQAGVEQADRGLIELGRSCRASERQIFTKIIIPCAFPYILAGVRLAIGRALIMIVVAELFASSVGIGFFISRLGSQFRTAEMFLSVLVLTFTGLVLSAVVRWLERRIAPWRGGDAA